MEDIPPPFELPAVALRWAQCRASWLQAVNDRFQLIGITRAGKIVKARNPPGEAIRGPSRSSTALDREPTAQTDPSRSLSFAFGTALPAPLPTFASAIRRAGGFR